MCFPSILPPMGQGTGCGAGIHFWDQLDRCLRNSLNRLMETVMTMENPQRARERYRERVLSRFPKRTDLWQVDDIAGTIRAIYERHSQIPCSSTSHLQAQVHATLLMEERLEFEDYVRLSLLQRRVCARSERPTTTTYSVTINNILHKHNHSLERIN